MKRRTFMKYAATQAAAVAVGTVALNNEAHAQANRDEGVKKTIKRPNIVVIVSDDHRADLMSCAGNKYIKTPNLDKMASEGIRFKNAFACSGVCSPSRASILTGKYSHEAAAPRIVWTNNSFRMQENPFPARLHDTGYNSSHFGKWHLGAGDTAMDGYDHWAGFEWLGDFFDTKLTINGEEKQFEGFSDDIISNLAAEYITEQAKTDQPFCTFVGLKAPHLHFKYPERLEHAFDGIDIPKPDSYNEDYSKTGRLDYVKNVIDIEKFAGGLPLFGNSWETYIKSYYRSAQAIDDAVGNILSAIEEAGISEDTIVIYTSDQGYTLGEHGLTEKHFAYEEPMRVPMIVKYPKMIKKGIERSEMALTIDIAPTLMDICNGAVPPDMSGLSWKPLLETSSDKMQDWREDFFFETVSPGNDIPGPVAVRTDRYKLITYPWINKEHLELFDLEKDPKEMKNLWKDPAYSSVLNDMLKRLDRLKKETNWSKVIPIPLKSCWVLDSVPDSELEDVRKQATSKSMRNPSSSLITVAGNTYQWQKSTSENGSHNLSELNPDKKTGTTFLAIEIDRLSNFDPYILVSIQPVIAMKGYVEGEKCHDSPGGPGAIPSLMSVYNPPLREGKSVFVLEFQTRDELRITVWAPEGKIELLGN